MDSNVHKGTRIEFSYFVSMALQNNMSWKTLAILLKDHATTLDKTREVICILLKELEMLQLTLKKKVKELENHQNAGFTPKTQPYSVEGQSDISEIETIQDDFQENVEQSLKSENRPKIERF